MEWTGQRVTPLPFFVAWTGANRMSEFFTFPVSDKWS
jgi:hypothetical protein